MIKEIVRDVLFLGQKSELANKEDMKVAMDLMDTLIANKHRCVGLAANMIGVKKRIIIFEDQGSYTIMFNPEIIHFSKPYTCKESCLSLDGEREILRYQSIKVRYNDISFQQKTKSYKDFTAQIIQHEIDHCHGIII